MNIFLRELRSNLTATLVWAVSLGLLAIVFLMLFRGFSNDVATTEKMISGLPKALQAALGISLKDFFTVYGFFAYVFTFVLLAGGIQAMNLGVGALSREDISKTTDFLLTKPVTRGTVIFSKLLANICLLIFTNLIFSGIGVITARAVSTGSFSAKTFLLISGSMFIVQLVFLALGGLFSVIIPKIKSMLAVSMPTVFIFFIIGTLGAIIGDTTVRYFTPFKFFDPMYIINNGHYEGQFLTEAILLFVVMSIVSYIIYIRKDIRAAS